MPNSKKFKTKEIKVTLAKPTLFMTPMKKSLKMPKSRFRSWRFYSKKSRKKTIKRKKRSQTLRSWRKTSLNSHSTAIWATKTSSLSLRRRLSLTIRSQRWRIINNWRKKMRSSERKLKNMRRNTAKSTKRMNTMSYIGAGEDDKMQEIV